MTYRAKCAFAALLFTASLVVPGCNDPNAGGPPNEFEQFCFGVDQHWGSQYTACLAAHGPLCAPFNEDNVCDEIAGAISAGKVRYDDSAFDSCYSAIDALPCGATDWFVGACQNVVIGNVTSGGDCANSYECADGAACISTGSTCGGTCQPRVAAGGSCEPAEDSCIAGTSCVVPIGQTSGSCTVSAAAPATESLACGSPCTPGLDECASFTFCSRNTNVCTPKPITVGAECISAPDADVIDCAWPSYCALSSDDGGTAVGVCQASCVTAW